MVTWKCHLFHLIVDGQTCPSYNGMTREGRDSLLYLSIISLSFHCTWRNERGWRRNECSEYSQGFHILHRLLFPLTSQTRPGRLPYAFTRLPTRVSHNLSDNREFSFSDDGRKCTVWQREVHYEYRMNYYLLVSHIHWRSLIFLREISNRQSKFSPDW